MPVASALEIFHSHCHISSRQAHYAYKCVTSDLADTMIDCEDLSTPLNDGPEGDKVEFLDRHVVQCPVNKV